MTTHPCEVHDIEAAEARLAGLLGAMVGDVRALTDEELQRRLVDVTKLTRLVDVASAHLAGEVAARSGREAGHAGLAARQGHRNAESLVRQLCGSSYREAAALVRVGSAIAAASGAPPGDVDAGGADRHSEAGDERMTVPRFGPVLDGLLGGEVALDAADGILRALSPVVGALDISDVGPVVENLARESRSAHADAVARMAGAARDALDRAGVAEREELRRSKRFLRIGPVIDGMRRLSGLLDPESAAVIVSAVDAVTAPRRGGPRFVDPADRTRAAEAVADIRSTEQLVVVPRQVVDAV